METPDRTRSGAPEEPFDRLLEYLADAPSPEPREIPVGTPIGRYLVLRSLGRGGMGEVYAATDPELDRQVAIKLLYSGKIGSDPSAGGARLLREAQALARLSHPNVLAVYDVGLWQEQVFIAMELVEGANLRQWLAERPRGWREVRAALLEAARGLAAAHDRGLVHRDVKPENLLVGSDGRVRVADFGLVRSTESDADGAAPTPGSALCSQLTLQGAIVGTPGYIAPEQHEGTAVDARTDQYAFCVVLHEALYGSRPGEERSSTAAKVPAWLGRVVTRGLERDPGRRYPSMHALIADLAHDPDARRRRRLAFALALAMAGVAVALTLLLQEPATARCSGAARKLAGVWDADRQAALQTRFAVVWDRLHAALDRYTAGWIQAHTEACEATHVHGEQSEALLDRRIGCLEDCRTELQALLETVSDPPAAGASGALTASKILTAAYALRPVAACADPRLLSARIARSTEDESVRREVARAQALHQTGRWREGLAMVERALAGAKEPVAAEGLFVKGRLYELLGDTERARAALEGAAIAAQASHHDEVLAHAWSELVYLHGYLRADPKEALSVARFADAALRRIGSPPADRATLLRHEGLSLNRAGHPAEGLAKLQTAVALSEQAYGAEHPNTALALVTTANLLSTLGRFEESLAVHERAREVFEKTLGREHPSTVMQLMNAGVSLRRLGRSPEALARFRECLRLRERIFGPDHQEVAAVLTNLANVLSDLGRNEEALAELRRALPIFEKRLPPAHLHVTIAHENIGNELDMLDRHAEALPHRRAALDLRLQSLGAENPWTLTARGQLAMTRVLAGESADAERDFFAALREQERRIGAEDLRIAELLESFAMALTARGRARDALPLLRRALAIREKKLGPEHPRTGNALVALGRALLATGARDEALQRLLASAAIAKKTGLASERAHAAFALAEALWRGPEDRPRALALARSALGDATGKLARQIRAWLAMR